jgi:diaminopimelate epimerase
MIGDNPVMRLKFSKMQGAGNDFVVIDAVRQKVDLSTQQWRKLADRHFGIGADQILVVEPSQQAGIDFRYRIFNADGAEVEQCGNGARCFVRFVRDQGLTDKRTLRVQTLNGVIEPSMADDGRITVDMGAPIFDLPSIPFDSTWLAHETIGDDRVWTVPLNGRQWKLSVLSMGNPHAVQTVTDVGEAPVLQDGPIIERHPAFPKRANIGFMQIVNQHEIRLRVFERGAGETLACGSGACAAVVTGIRRKLLQGPVDVVTRGGRLTIDWQGGSVSMTGPAESVFTGEIEI